jgi:hypothetical protein
MGFLLVVLGFAMLLCFVASIKNELVYSIHSKWIFEKYENPAWQDVHLPEYMEMFWNITLWKYIPLSEYNKKRGYVTK